MQNKRLLFALTVFVGFFIRTGACAQTVISGTVKNADNKPIDGVVVKLLSDGKMSAFAITSDNGTYTLKTDSKQSTLQISFEHLSYEKKILSISNKSQTIDAVLEGKVSELKEVTVAAPKVRENGDTLTFRLSSFAGKGDVSLEDAMKKIPGINVETDGSIKYMGKAISNFYIEGMDLLGGKYSIATKNIPANYVSNVEVLNHHQDAKIDKDIFSDNVALNIKLNSKAKLKPVGTSEALAGYGDKRVIYEIGTTGMLFTPRIQTIITAKIGNDKEFADAESSDHFEQEKGIRSKVNSVFGNVSGDTPPLDNERFITPQDKLISANSIQKLSKESTFRTNINYAFSKSSYEYGTESRYYTGGNELVINEDITPLSKIHKPTLEMEYKLNKDKRFVDDKLTFAVNFIEKDFSTIDSGQPLEQNKTARMIDFKNNFDWRLKTGSRYWNVSSLVQYTATPKCDFNISEKNGTKYQSGHSGSFYTEELINTIYEFSHSRLYLPFTVKFTYDDLETNLQKNGNSYANQLYGMNFNPVFYPRYEYNTLDNRFIFRIGVTGKGYIFNVRNSVNDNSIKYNRLFADPDFYINYTLSSNSTLLLESSIKHEIGDVTDLLTNPVQNTYRSQTVKCGVLGKSRTLSADLRYEYKIPLDFWFLNADISYKDIKRNLLSSQYVTEDETTLSDLLNDNTSRNIFTDISVTKLIQPINTKINLTGTYSWQQQKIIQQDQLIPYFGRCIAGICNITVQPWGWFELDYSGDLSRTFDKYHNINSSYLSQSHNAKLSIFPVLALQLYTNYNFVREEIGTDIYKNMSLCDAGIRYKWKLCKLSFQVNNLLNLKQYSYKIFNGLDSFSYNYRLRGRNFIVSLILFE